MLVPSGFGSRLEIDTRLQSLAARDTQIVTL
jgi:hypothetical protein